MDMKFKSLNPDYIEAMALDLLANGVVTDLEQAERVLAKFWEDKRVVTFSPKTVQDLIQNPDFYLSDEDALSVLESVSRKYDIGKGLYFAPPFKETLYSHLESMVKNGSVELKYQCEKGNYWQEGSRGRLLIRRGKFILVRYGATEFVVYDSPSYGWELLGFGCKRRAFESIGAAIQYFALWSSTVYY